MAAQRLLFRHKEIANASHFPQCDGSLDTIEPQGHIW
jgi:hypothetical protein